MQYKIAIAPNDEAGLTWARKVTEVASILLGGDWQKPGQFYPEGFQMNSGAVAVRQCSTRSGRWRHTGAQQCVQR